VKLQRDVDELTSSSRPHSSQLSMQRELDSVKQRHRKHVADLEQTIDGLRQQLLRLRARELSMCCVFLQCFDAVASSMTYNMFGGTLNLIQSQCVC